MYTTYFLLNMSMTMGQAAAPPSSPYLAPPPAVPFVSVVPTPVTAAPTSGPGVMPALPFLRTAADDPPKKDANGNGDKKNGDKNGDKEKEPEKPKLGDWAKPKQEEGGGFFHRLYRIYYNQFYPPEKKPDEPEPEPPARGGKPSPWPSPPFPMSEYNGYPLVGGPVNPVSTPLMLALYGADTPFSNWVKDSRIAFDGWLTTYGVWGTAHQSNTPDAYWVKPNNFGLDQAVLQFRRIVDSVQQDHFDWGFRFASIYGIDYRYTISGGWGLEQEQIHNLLNGWDPVEAYFDFYMPGFLGGTELRVGRWISCPDIESQYSIDNYLGSHSILFSYDTYTVTGIMLSQKINDNFQTQLGVHAGTDMAPWYQGAVWTAQAGLRWVSDDNKDGLYLFMNDLNSARFRHFVQDGVDSGHENFNWIGFTYQHTFSESIHSKTEAYYMWEFNGELGGTPSLGTPQFGAGGGNGLTLPGLCQYYGVLNYTQFALSDRDYICVRNEWVRDERGMRTGYAGNYTSNTIGFSHQFNDVLMIRPEIGYYRNWSQQAFDNGTQKGIMIYGFDLTFHF
jgi:hypothetical protein